MPSPFEPVEPPAPFDPLPQREPITLADLLRARTPHLWITRGLVAVNALVFALMVLAGVDPMSPSVPELLEWGANLGELTGDGEAWRLLTCTFVHAGFLHVAMNLWVLWQVGPLVERLLGNVGFLVTYVLSGLAGSLASGLSHPAVTSVGASGAVFGVVGALLGVLVRRPIGLPEEGRRMLRRQMLMFVGLNVFIGFAIPQIDMAGHLGGLAAGFVAGLVLGRRNLLLDTRGRNVRNLALALSGGVVIAIGACFLPSGGSGALRARLDFAALLERTEVVARSVDERYGRGALTEAQRNTIVERDLIAPWRELAERAEALPPDEAGVVLEMRREARRILASFEEVLLPIDD